jgi:hypothetical protein
MMELLASYNEQVGAIILDNASQNAKNFQSDKNIWGNLLCS